MKTQLEPIFTRIENARINFVQSVMEQFGKTETEAHHVLDVFIKEKAVKLCVALGRYQLTHGGYWELDVINTALTM